MEELLSRVAKMSPGVISIEEFPGTQEEFQTLISQGHLRKVGEQGFIMKYNSFLKFKN